MTGYVQAAREALNFIESQRAGAVWRTNDHPKARPAHSLYHGAGGVILLLLELHAQSGEPQLMEKALAAGDEILAALPTFEDLSINSSTGWGGYVFVLGELARITGHARYRDGAAFCLGKIRDLARPIGSGVGWIEPAPFGDITGFTDDREVFDQSVGSAGVILTLLYADREALDDQALPLARAAAERLLEVAEPTPEGLRWKMMADMPFQFTAPNFAHGGAGVGYALLQLHQGDRRGALSRRRHRRCALCDEPQPSGWERTAGLSQRGHPQADLLPRRLPRPGRHRAVVAGTACRHRRGRVGRGARPAGRRHRGRRRAGSAIGGLLEQPRPVLRRRRGRRVRIVAGAALGR